MIHLGSPESNRQPEQKTAVGLMARLGLTSTGDWQEHALSSALRVTANGPGAWALWQTLWCTITTADVWIAPAEQTPVRLLLCDMDSTLITTESLDELAAHTGIGEQVAAITARAMNGELDFIEALRQRVGLLKNLDYEVVERCVLQSELSEGALALMAKARQHDVRTVLISGGFTPFAEHVAKILGMDHYIANRLDVVAGKLSGRVIEPIVTKDTKLQVLRKECETLNIELAECCTLGDGANDISMLQAAGTGVAYRAKEVVLSATPQHLIHAPLDVLTEWLPWPP